VTLAECVIGGPYAPSGIGATVNLTPLAETLTPHQWLFGEDHGRVVISCSHGQADGVLALAAAHGVPALAAGTVGERHGALTISAGSDSWQWPADELRGIFFNAIPRRLQHVVTDAASEG
jgi:phosphoribosylformylglycinamidine (FGAM) synthase-like enzyme